MMSSTHPEDFPTEDTSLLREHRRVDRWQSVKYGGFVVLFVVISVVFSVTLAKKADKASNDLDGAVLIKSASDKRSYRMVELANNLQALLISDPRTDKAAASLDVHVGSMSDPEEIPGLAHFLEHMLFLGTEKYPEENSYNTFLSANGGGSNAYTALEDTNYFFDIADDQLEPALDRFAQFFIAPLFNENSTDREMHAVDSENNKNLQSDSWRFMQLLRSSANPKHPFHKFGTGNLHTLQSAPQTANMSTRDALLAFHNKYYSASSMRLAVIGRESLDTLQGWVLDKFALVVDKPVEKIDYTALPPPFRGSNLGRIVRILPVSDIRQLDIYWPLGDMRPFYKNKPTEFIGHLLGYEGKGSLLSLLKNNGWVNRLSAGLDEETSGFSLFTVSLSLTADGLDKTDVIISYIYQYIALIKKFVNNADAVKAVWEDTAALQDIQFRFAEDVEPVDLVSSLSSNMQHYPPGLVIAGPTLFFEFDADIVKSVLKSLSPAQSRIHVASKTFNTTDSTPAWGTLNATEKWYGTSYNDQAFSEAQLSLWTAAASNIDSTLKIMGKSQFVPTDFSLVAEPVIASNPNQTDGPLLLVDNSKLKLWYHLDTAFNQPKVNIRIYMFSPHTSSSPRNSVLTTLYVSLLLDSLAEDGYDARLAGLGYDVKSDRHGIELDFSGFNEKMEKVVNLVVNRLKTLIVQKERFDIIKDQLVRSYKNFKNEQPYSHALYYNSLLMHKSQYTIEDSAGALDSISQQDVQAFIPVLLGQLKIESLVHGNIDSATAQAILQSVLETLKFNSLPLSDLSRQQIVSLNGSHVFRAFDMNAENVNSATMTLFQRGPMTLADDALLDLMSHMADEPAFNKLRTEQQLGYVVWTGTYRDSQVQSFRIIVQGSAQPPHVVDTRVEEFLVYLRTYFTNMHSDDFTSFKSSLKLLILQRDQTMSDVTDRYWREIVSHNYMFDRRKKVAAALETVSQRDLIQFFDELTGQTRHKMSIQIYSKQIPIPSDPLVVDASNRVPKLLSAEDILTFKNSSTFFPPQPLTLE